MATPIDRHYIVKVLCNGKMLKEDVKTFDTLSEAIKRAEACASEGEYAEIREIIITERMIQRFEAL